MTTETPTNDGAELSAPETLKPLHADSELFKVAFERLSAIGLLVDMFAEALDSLGARLNSIEQRLSNLGGNLA